MGDGMNSSQDNIQDIPEVVEAESEGSSDEDDVQIEINTTDATKTFQISSDKPEKDKKGIEKEIDETTEQKLIDLTGVGNIQGKPVIDFDIDSMAEKPWNKKGENVSNYFNYGFTEDTWKVYQLEIKGKSTENLPPPIRTIQSGPPPVIQTNFPARIHRSPGSAPPPFMPRGPPPGFPPGMTLPPGMPPLMPPGMPPGMFGKAEPIDDVKKERM